MSIFKKVNYIFSARQKIQAFLLCFGLFIGALFELAGVSLITELVSLISSPGKIHENALLSSLYDRTGMSSDREFFALVIICLIIVYIIKNVYLLWLNYIEYSYIYDNQVLLSNRLIDCYLKKPYTYHLDVNSSEMVRNVMLDTERFFQMLLSVLMMLSEALLSLLLCIYLFVVDWFISLTVVVILLIVLGLYMLLFKNRTKRYGDESHENDAKMHKAINQALGAVKDIKILHREGYFVNSFAKYGAKKARVVRNNSVLGQAPKYLIETVCIGAILLVLLIKIFKGEDLANMIPQLAAFALAAFKLLPSASKISNYVNLILFLKPSADLIYRDIKDTEDMMSFEVKDALETEAKDSDEVRSVSIEHLTYRYPHSDTDVIRDVSFKVPLGAAVGLIGPSGAGKSTIADVILGILTPTEGRVMYGSMNVHEHPLKWSEKLAYIPQSIYLSDESIRNNVAFGIDDEEIDDEKVWAALEEAQLASFVRGLSDKLDTTVGERGVRLSGGQRQRIGIARALYNDPEILVLDEATSALDNDTETAVMEAIDSLAGRKTLIVIAHRLTTIRNCEPVYRVENGKVEPVKSGAKLTDQIRQL